MACEPMRRPKRAEPNASFDPELAELPEPLRWREWMGRIEAAIFAAREPVPRAALARLVGASCNLDALIEDIAAELRSRPYALVFVAGGWQMRTRSHYAEAIRAANDGATRAAGAPELTPTELLALSAIAYLQPATRAEISRMAGKEISRDVIGRLKRLGLIDGALRAPEPGAPFAYVTTRKFLEAFGLARLRDLPDLDRLEEEGLLQRRRFSTSISITPSESRAMTIRKGKKRSTISPTDWMGIRQRTGETGLRIRVSASETT